MSERPARSAILCVTANLAMDVTYELDQLVPGGTHRARRVAQRAGGKGVNVARILHRLGHPVCAVGAAGGARGREIEADLADSGVPYELAHIRGDSRRTVTLVAEGTATLVNEPGPELSRAEWSDLSTMVQRSLAGSSVLVLAGSLPRGAATAAGYADLIASATQHGVPTVLDTSGAALRTGVAAGPAIVKPNADELSEITGYTDPIAGAAALRELAPVSVVVSLGEDGMLAVTDEGTWRAVPPRRVRGNATGAGDAVVAALAAGEATGTPWPDRLSDAVALSAAAVAADLAGDIDARWYREHRDLSRVEEIRVPGIHR